MSRTFADKQAAVSVLKETLSETQLTVVIDFKGLNVTEITDLRNRLRPTGTVCTVAKNALMRIAVDGDQNWQVLTQFLAGSSAFLLVKEDFKGAIKAYQDFQKTTKKTELRGGVMEGRALSEVDLQAITELPSKEELMARIAGAINAIPTQLAVGLNAVPTQLAVGIKEVPGSLARALQAIAQDTQAAE